MGSLDARVAVITGAGRGIGHEHALSFALATVPFDLATWQD